MNRPPYETFKRATCKGSYVLGSACGQCERCEWERNEMQTPTATDVKPVYRKVEEGKGKATKIYMIICDEGWRESIVCTGMYGWAADWLLRQIQGKPYAVPDRDQPRAQ